MEETAGAQECFSASVLVILSQRREMSCSILFLTTQNLTTGVGRASKRFSFVSFIWTSNLFLLFVMYCSRMEKNERKGLGLSGRVWCCHGCCPNLIKFIAPGVKCSLSPQKEHTSVGGAVVRAGETAIIFLDHQKQLCWIRR